MQIFKHALAGLLIGCITYVEAHGDHPCTDCAGPKGSYHYEHESGPWEYRFIFEDHHLWFEFLFIHEFPSNSTVSELMYVSSPRMKYSYDSETKAITMNMNDEVSQILNNVKVQLAEFTDLLWSNSLDIEERLEIITNMYTPNISDIVVKDNNVSMKFESDEDQTLIHHENVIDLKRKYALADAEKRYARPTIIDNYVPASDSLNLVNADTTTKSSLVGWSLASGFVTVCMMTLM